MNQNIISTDDVVSAITNNIEQPKQEITIETMALLIHSNRLKQLETKLTKEFTELKNRQDQVSFLHKLIKSINAAIVKDGFDCTTNAELKDMLAKASEMGVEIVPNKFKYTKEERERLIDNVKMTCDDLNVLNDMQLQAVTRLTSERYESYQLARAIMKPLHDDKVNKARAIHNK